MAANMQHMMMPPQGQQPQHPQQMRNPPPDIQKRIFQHIATRTRAPPNGWQAGYGPHDRFRRVMQL